MEIINFYTKNDGWYELSNFYPQGFEEDGHYWPTVEHYFQAMKFAGDEHADYQEEIRKAPSAQRAKELGRTRSRPLREDWSTARDEVMLHAARRKFAHPKLKAILLSTGDAHLQESSPFDFYWGTGDDGSGVNRMGLILMQVRTELREQEAGE